MKVNQFLSNLPKWKNTILALKESYAKGDVNEIIKNLKLMQEMCEISYYTLEHQAKKSGKEFDTKQFWNEANKCFNNTIQQCGFENLERLRLNYKKGMEVEKWFDKYMAALPKFYDIKISFEDLKKEGGLDNLVKQCNELSFVLNNSEIKQINIYMKKLVADTAQQETDINSQISKFIEHTGLSLEDTEIDKLKKIFELQKEVSSRDITTQIKDAIKEFISEILGVNLHTAKKALKNNISNFVIEDGTQDHKPAKQPNNKGAGR